MKKKYAAHHYIPIHYFGIWDGKKNCLLVHFRIKFNPFNSRLQFFSLVLSKRGSSYKDEERLDR